MTHKEKARDLFLSGYNCAQSVFVAFCDVTGYKEEEALRISSPFGGGMGHMREVCGACSGMFLALGCLEGYSDPSDAKAKAELYEKVQALSEKFKEKNGTIICRDLLGFLAESSGKEPQERTAEYYKVRPCVRFVEDAAEILDAHLAREREKIQNK